jgi:hypothetical protein
VRGEVGVRGAWTVEAAACCVRRAGPEDDAAAACVVQVRRMMLLLRAPWSYRNRAAVWSRAAACNRRRSGRGELLLRGSKN